MKQLYTTTKTIITLAFLTALTLTTKAQNNVGIGTTAPNPKAILELQAIDKGLLVPRLTGLQMNAIPLTATEDGLLIYNTDSACYCFYNKIAWQNLCKQLDTVALKIYLTTHNKIINKLTTTANTIKSTVNGVADSATIINSITNTYDTLTGAFITTVNGVPTTAILLPNTTSITDSITSQAWLLKGNNANATNQLGTLNARNLNIITNSTTRISVMSGTGNVGIGQTLPSAKLDVLGDVQFSNDLKPAGLSGTTGDLLISQGAGLAPKWVAQNTIVTTTANTLTNPINTITSTVNGVTATAPAVNTVSNTYNTTTGDLSTTVNGVTGANVVIPTAQNITDSIKTQAWLLKGNAGTTAGTNFIGTTDNQDLVFKRNNVQAGLINTALQNTALGVSALNPTTTGSANTAFGFNALMANTTGGNNTAIGTSVLANNLIGHNNVGLGYLTLNKNDSGTVNVAIGAYSMQNQQGNNCHGNTALGYGTLAGNLSGSANVAVGYFALRVNTSGTENTSVGNQSMYYNTTGQNNVALGSAALHVNTTGNFNSAIGARALYGNTTGNDNVGIGYYSLANNNSGRGNTALGVTSLISNTSGRDNVALGIASLLRNATGSDNVGIGANSLYLNTTGGGNVAVGRDAGKGIAAGNANTSIGSSTMVYINSNKNTALGTGAFAGAFAPLVSSTKTCPSTNVTIASGQVIITGHGFGTAPASIYVQVTSTGAVPAPYGQGSVFLGNIIDANTIDFGNQIFSQGTGTLTFTPHDTTVNQYVNSTAIGYDAQPTASNQIQLGDGNVTEVRTRGTLVPSITNTADVGTALLRWRNAYFAGSVNASCGVLVCSDVRYKQQITPLTNSLAKLTKLQGVNYYFKTNKFKDRNFNTNLQIGVIAQEAEKILPEVVSTDAAGYKSVDYSKFTPLLIEAIKELNTKHDKEIQELRQEIELLKKK